MSEPHHVSLKATFVAGAGSGVIAALFTSPLDVVKIRAQAGDAQGGASLVLRKVYSAEGVRGLYRGLGPTLFGLVPTWAVFFSVYSFFRDSVFGDVNMPMPVKHLLSSVSAGAVNTVMMNPVWTIRTRLATQPAGSARLYEGMWHGIFRIAREEGVRGLFKGLSPSLLGLTHVAVQFPVYEAMKKKLASRRNSTTDKLHASELFFASAVSKIFASVSAYPHEVLRTRLQDQRAVNGPPKYRGLRNTIVTIWKEEGLRGLYRGMGTNLPRVTLSCAITFTSYELLLQLARDAGL